MSIPEDRFLVHRTPLPQAGPGAWDAEARLWKGRGINTIILDNLLGLLPPGHDVKESSAVAPLLRQCTDLTSKGFAVLVIHHSAKPSPMSPGGGGSPMGSQAIEAAARCTLMLSVQGCPADGFKRLQVRNNSGPPLDLRLRLNVAEACELLPDSGSQDLKPSRTRKRQDETWARLRADALALLEAPPETRKNQSVAGRWLASAGLAVNGDAGRNRVRVLLGKNWLRRGPGGVLLAGPHTVGALPAT